MSDAQNVVPGAPDQESIDESRRGFVRNVASVAVAGVAGLTALKEAIAAPTATPKPQLEVKPNVPLTPAEHEQERKRVQAETLLREAAPGQDIHIEWVRTKGSVPRVRKVIQLNG